jgi:hypothetical protein
MLNRLNLAIIAAAISLGASPLPCLHAQPAGADFGTWNDVAAQGPLSAAETRAFMKQLAQYVHDHHLRRAAAAPMRGMVYEYFDPRRQGKADQWVQGEALDTMHDGAWLAAALVNAFRVTGEAFYKEFLTQWLLPFYCRMLNHSDELFSAARNGARPKAQAFDKERQLQGREKGFVPYWWDDGASVSLERRRDRNPLAPFSCTDDLAGRENPEFRLSGYSHGSSNHLAQDLGVMLQQAWLLLRESNEPAERKLAEEVADAAWNLHQCRMRHHGHIPMCDAPAALARGDRKLMRHVPDQSGAANWDPANHYTRAFGEFKRGQRMPFPAFADDQHYRYYFGIARHAGRPPRALAFRTIYDALTEPLLFRAYCDDAVRPPGINRFDLHPYHAVNGRPEDYRSDRKGPGGKPRPVGSRMGPQNMVCAGWALQFLKEFPGIWEERYRIDFPADSRVYIHDPVPGKQEPIRRTTLALGERALRVYARRESLVIEVLTPGAGELKVCSRPDGQGTAATIRFKGDQELSVTGDDGKPLMYRRFDAGPDGGFRAFLYFAVRKEQSAWASGIEHGRWSVESGGKVVNLYLASAAEQVKDWLAHDLGCGLRVWREIFRGRGYIPTGIGAGEWDQFSDSGGYAHLISAASQWLLCLDGRKDWETHRVPELE